jgi:hypothetical protein
MSLIWTKADGSVAVINSLDEYEACFIELDADCDRAAAEKRATDVAQFQSARSVLFARYLDAQISAARVEQADVRGRISRGQLSLPWWLELHNIDPDVGPPVEVSPAQRAIFGHGQIMPQSWDHAKAALDLLPEYTPPPKLQLSAAIPLLQTFNDKATVLSEAVDANLEALQKAKADLSDWENFRQVVYPKYLTAKAAFDTAAGALDAGA